MKSLKVWNRQHDMLRIILYLPTTITYEKFGTARSQAMQRTSQGVLCKRNGPIKNTFNKINGVLKSFGLRIRILRMLSRIMSALKNYNSKSTQICQKKSTI